MPAVIDSMEGKLPHISLDIPTKAGLKAVSSPRMDTGEENLLPKVATNHPQYQSSPNLTGRLSHTENLAGKNAKLSPTKIPRTTLSPVNPRPDPNNLILSSRLSKSKKSSVRLSKHIPPIQMMHDERSATHLVPVDFINQYSLIDVDRIPYYERIFKKVTADQTYRYGSFDADISKDTDTEDMPPENKLTEKQMKGLENFKMLSKDAIPRIAGENEGDQMMSKAKFMEHDITVRSLEFQYELDNLQEERIDILAELAGKFFPEVLTPDYVPEVPRKKGKKGKKKKSKKSVVSVASVDQRRPKSKSMKLTSAEIVARLSNRMMVSLEGDPEIKSITRRIERYKQKIREAEARIQEVKGDGELFKMHAQNIFHADQDVMARSEMFIRKQSASYQKLNPQMDIEMNLTEVEDALSQINTHLLNKREMEYIYHVLDLPGRQRINIRTFSAIAALSEKVASVEALVKQRINKMNVGALCVKIQRCKELFWLLHKEDLAVPRGMVSAEALAVELIAGGLKSGTISHIMTKFNREERGVVSFIDFLIYIPLFITIHKRIIRNPFALGKHY